MSVSTFTQNSLEVFEASTSNNVIINGAFEINQRGATAASPASDVPGYVFDRWFLISSQGNGSTSSQTFTPGNAIPGYESSNFVRLSTPNTTKSDASESMIQRIENVRTFAGQTVTISFWAKSGSGTPNISIELNQNFGTGGSPSSQVNTYVNKTAISTSWTRYTATITVPSISGKTVGTTANTSYLELRIWCSAGSDFNSRTNSLSNQNNTFDFWGVQLESGPTATPFRRNAPSIQAELAACQRYYWRQTATTTTSWYAGFGSADSTTTGVINIPLPVTMRTVPSSIETSNIRLNDWITPTATTSMTLSGNSTPSTVVIVGTVASGLTQFRPMLFQANNNLSSFIGINAEL
jgi:hypothetical protein